jgi:hypothetical protein
MARQDALLLFAVGTIDPAAPVGRTLPRVGDTVRMRPLRAQSNGEPDPDFAEGSVVEVIDDEETNRLPYEPARTKRFARTALRPLRER